MSLNARIVLFIEWEEDEATLPYHAAYAEQGAVVTWARFGHWPVYFCHYEDGDSSCWLGGLHAF